MNEEKRCHDCGAKPGELHKAGCDTERCSCCKRQLISCGCPDVEHPNWIADEDEDGKYWWPADPERLPWTGTMYEEEQKVAIQDGKFTRWEEGKGWVACLSGQPGARPDINYGATKVQKVCPHQ